MTAAPPDPALIARALDLLDAGGLVAIPTETVYGLAADADSAAAVTAIFEAKARPADHPVIVHVAGAGALAAWSRPVPPAAIALARRFWPGPLTMIVPASARALPVVTGGQDTVGLRSPAHPWARQLLAGWVARRRDPAAALAAPSANRFGQLSPTTANHVRAGLGERPAGPVDLVLDGGPADVGIESTIVDLSREPFRILRPGAIGADALAQVLGRDVDVAGDAAPAPRVSGRLEQHYAPRKPLDVIAREELALFVLGLAPARVGVLAPAELLEGLPANASIRRPAAVEASDYARALYGELHELDAGAIDRIVVTLPPEGSDWLGVRDRLRRAGAATSAATSVATRAGSGGGRVG